jgi:hypothetical protein
MNFIQGQFITANNIVNHASFAGDSKVLKPYNTNNSGIYKISFRY